MDIQESLRETAGNVDVKDLVTTVADLGINEVVDSELLQKIPLFGVLVKGVDIVSTIQNRIFLKKLAEFLRNIDIVSQEKKDYFWSKINNHGDLKFGEHILFIIDKTESVEQAAIVGKLFRALVLDEISSKEFETLVYAVRNIFLTEFNLLKMSPKDLQFASPRKKGILYNHELLDNPYGLLDESASSSSKAYPDGNKYVISELGVKFMKIAFGEDIKYKKFSSNELHQLHADTVKNL